MIVNPKFIDLSHYDNVEDGFTGAVKFGIRGVINKLTEGVGCLDKSFAWRRKPAANAGLLYGAYHFIRPGRITQQADWFLQNLPDDETSDKLRLVLDHETAGVSLADVRIWLERVHGKTGQWPWLYSYSSFLCDQFLAEGGIDDPFWPTIGLWIAAYNDHPHWPKCWEKPVAWQYTGDGEGQEPHNVTGIVIAGGKGIDINSFDGTDDEFAAAWTA